MFIRFQYNIHSFVIQSESILRRTPRPRRFKTCVYRHKYTRLLSPKQGDMGRLWWLVLKVTFGTSLEDAYYLSPLQKFLGPVLPSHLSRCARNKHPENGPIFASLRLQRSYNSTTRYSISWAMLTKRNRRPANGRGLSHTIVPGINRWLK